MRIFTKPVDDMGHWNAYLPNGRMASMTVVNANFSGWGVTKDKRYIAFLSGERVPGLAATFLEMEALIQAFDRDHPTIVEWQQMRAKRAMYGTSVHVDVDLSPLRRSEIQTLWRKTHPERVSDPT